MKDLIVRQDVLDKIDFEVEDDVVVRYTPIHLFETGVYKKEIIMTKEIFQECYKKWIEPQGSKEE